jgi:hypothetical protein
MNPQKLIVLLLSFVLGNCSTPREISLNKEVLKVLLHPKTEFFYSTDKIPGKMLAKAKRASEKTYSYDGIYAMANPNEKFKSNCTGGDSLMSRRLVFVASLKNFHVLCYERGGRSHNLLISFSQIRTIKSSYYNLSLSGIPIEAYTNPEQIKLALKENRFNIWFNNGQKTARTSVPF